MNVPFSVSEATAASKKAKAAKQDEKSKIESLIPVINNQIKTAANNNQKRVLIDCVPRKLFGDLIVAYPGYTVERAHDILVRHKSIDSFENCKCNKVMISWPDE